MSTELLTRPTTTAVTPRVNLLPPEIADASRLRTRKVQLGVGLLATVGVVGLLFVVASGQVTSAQDALDQATAQTAQTKTKVQALSSVPLVYGQVAAAQAQLQTAMGPEVRWSEFLTDLSIQTPANISLTSVTVTQSAPGAEGSTSVLGTPGIAGVELQGEARAQNDLATFLDKLSRQNNQLDPFFTSAAVELDAESQRDIVRFAASTTVSDTARSNRFVEGG